jgi:hypothetical protein
MLGLERSLWSSRASAIPMRLPGGGEPPDQDPYSLGEALALLATLEDVSDALIGSDHLAEVVAVENSDSPAFAGPFHLPGRSSYRVGACQGKFLLHAAIDTTIVICQREFVFKARSLRRPNPSAEPSS